jgi:hypothetical protein
LEIYLEQTTQLTAGQIDEMRAVVRELERRKELVKKIAKEEKQRKEQQRLREAMYKRYKNTIDIMGLEDASYGNTLRTYNKVMGSSCKSLAAAPPPPHRLHSHCCSHLLLLKYSEPTSCGRYKIYVLSTISVSVYRNSAKRDLKQYYF